MSYTEYERWRDSFHVGGENPEIEDRNRAYYQTSKERYQNAIKNDYLITYYGEGCHDSCAGCEYLHDVGMRDDTDDIGLMYCDNKECRYHKIAKIEQFARNIISERMYSEIDGVEDDEFHIIAIELYGSYLTAAETPASDIDILVEYEGSLREDDAFNMLHEDAKYYNGRKIDINPIKYEKSGNIEEFLARTGHKCNWSDCPFNKDHRCKQKDGGGLKHGMDKMGRFFHEKQPEEVKLHCRCCIPDLGQFNNK